MFGYTDNNSKPSQSPRSLSNGARPAAQSNRPSSPIPYIRSIQKENQPRIDAQPFRFSDRAPHRTYNRIPSPPGATIRARNVVKESNNFVGVERAKDRAAAASVPRIRPASDKLSNAIKQSVQDRYVKKARPKTGLDKQTTDKLISSSFESEILLTIRDVMGNLMKRKGPLGESDLEYVMKYTKCHLRGEKVLDDDYGEIPKMNLTTHTTANLNISHSEEDAKRITTSDGMVKKQIEDPSIDIDIKNNTNIVPSTVKGVLNEGTNEDSYFQSTLNDLNKRESKSQFSTVRVLEKEQVGDSEDTGKIGLNKLPYLLKSAEEVNIRAYIERLVKEINHDMKINKNTLATHQQTDIEKGNIETCNSITKTFCVCNVCTSDRITSQQPLPLSNDSQCRIKVIDLPQLRNKISTRSINIISSNLSSRPNNPNLAVGTSGMKIQRNFEAASKCKVLKRNQHFKPEPKVYLTSHPNVSKERKEAFLKGMSYTLIDPLPTDEAHEGLYLQRRNKQVVAKRA